MTWKGRCARRIALACLAATFAGGTLPPAEAKGKEFVENRVAIEPAPKAQPGLLDCRSPVVTHETSVGFGEPFAFAGNRLTFSLAGKSLQISILEAGAEKPRTVAAAHLPFLLALKAFDLPYALSVRLDGERKHVVVSSAFGVAVSLGAETAYLVDSDRDGKLGTAGDGVVAPGCRTVAPWTNTVWSRTVAADVRWNGTTSSWEASAAPMPHPDRYDHAAGWRLYQWRRQQCGLLPVAYDADLEPGMRAHAEYCVVNKYSGHEETPGKPGYSEEGLAAGRVCSISYEKPSFVEGLEDQFSAVFHRDGCLHADLARTAMVLHRGVFLLRTHDGRDGPLKAAVVVWPSHGMSSVPLRFNEAGEVPMPAPGGLANHFGTCVSVCSPAWERDGLGAATTLVLEMGDDKHGFTSVAGNAYTSGKPSRVPAYDDQGTAAYLPDSPLPAMAAFRARVRVESPTATAADSGADASPEAKPADLFRYEWEFSTGK